LLVLMQITVKDVVPVIIYVQHRQFLLIYEIGG
jgi:hypothetical protein